MERFALERGEVDLAARQLRLPDGEPIKLTAREVEVLRRLVREPGRTVPREELEQQVWGFAPTVQSEAVPVAMRRLRSKLEADPSDPVHLHTVQGEGWALTLLATADPDAPRGNLGASLDALVGRDDDMAALTTSEGRWLTLLGPPGVGRSRLAVEAARALDASDEVDEAWRVDGTGVRDGDALRARVASTIGADVDGLLEALHARGRVLLVLDDLDARAVAETVQAWLADLTALRIWIVGTRAGRPAEQLVTVQPLAPAAAVTLLQQRAQAVGATVDEAHARAAVDAVDRLPVGIELVAAQAHLWPSEHLVQRAPALATDRLSAAVQRALGHLPEVSREALGALSAFVGPFDVQGAEAVAGPDAVAHLATWVDRALVQLTPGAPLPLRLLGPVRRAAAGHGPDAAVDRHTAWMIRFAEVEGARLDTVARPEALARLVAAEPDLHEVLGRTAGAARVRLALALDRFLTHRGDHRARRALLADLPDPLPARAGEVWAQRGIVAALLGELDEARRALDEATAVEADHPRVLRYRAFLALRLGRHGEALTLARQGLAAPDDPRRTADDAGTLWGYVALAHTRAGERAEAEAALRSGLAVCRSGGATLREAVLQHQLGDHFSHLCVYDRALEALEQAVTACRDAALAEHEARSLIQLAMVHVQAGRPAHAREPAERGLALLERVGDAGVAAEALNNLADLALEQGRYDEAERLCARAMRAAERPGLRRYRAIVGFTRATVARVTGAPELALQHLEGAAHDAGDSPREGAWVHAVRAALLADRGDLDAAEASLARARGFAGSCGDPLLEPLLALCAGHLSLAEGDEGAARAALQAAGPWLDRGLDIRICAEQLRSRVRAVAGAGSAGAG